MTNERRYIEVTRTRTADEIQHIYFFKVINNNLILDHYVKQEILPKCLNGIAVWNRLGETSGSSPVCLTLPREAVEPPEDVWAEARLRLPGIWEETPDNPCWGAAP